MTTYDDIAVDITSLEESGVNWIVTAPVDVESDSGMWACSVEEKSRIRFRLSCPLCWSKARQ